ncbi:MAG: DUF2029 domain-containing protein [Sciscionella sp.]|nr:DUF2029 domain-containing protein [Sciscionella sp.]
MRARLGWCAIAIVGLIIVAAIVLRPWLRPPDFQVYRLGALAWAHGAPIYGRLPSVGGKELLFTYPPVAAVIFVPLAVLPLSLATAIFSAFSLAALGFVVYHCMPPGGLRLAPRLASRLVGRRVRALSGDRRATVALTVALTVLAAALQPMRETFGLGQINLVLMAMVFVDAFRVGDRWRGVATGIAAGIKLTPLVFVLFFLLRKDSRASGRMLAGFAGTVALGFALAPGDSASYWSQLSGNATRVGTPATDGNQSLYGLALRLGLPTSAWLAASAVTVVLGALATRACLARGERVLALCAVAVVGLLVSPVSWTHHWVWIVPILLALADRARPADWILVGLGLTLFAAKVGKADSAFVCYGIVLLGYLVMPLRARTAATLKSRRATRSASSPQTTH